jgi:DNA processing protein
VSVSASCLDLLTLLRLRGVGPRGAIRLAAADELAEARRSRAWGDARAFAEAIVEQCEASEIQIVGWFDETFPVRLREIPQPPAVLYYRGRLEVAACDRLVAIVGTRRPSTEGADTARRISRSFAEAGRPIVSGLALGIDTIAHEAALAAHVPTVAVLGNGLDYVYPPANHELAHQIIEHGGLLLAEAQPGTRASAHELVARDRLQSGLSGLTIVCQAGLRSGAMHTARFATEQHRLLFVPAVESPTREEDQGIDALQHLPARQLPERLPSWKRIRASLIDSDEPIAQVLTATSLSALLKDSRPAPANAAGPDRLF